MNAHAIEKTELNKILAVVGGYATLDGSKEKLAALQPSAELSAVKKSLKLTEECIQLLFTHGVSKVEYFPVFSDEIARAKKGSTLNCAELLSMAQLLRSARIAYTGVVSVNDESIFLVKDLVANIYFNRNLEDDISTKIVSETELADDASDKLYSLRREIRLLNERIRARLSEYLTGSESKYLQEGIVTMRDNRYVLPVRAEYKRSVKGFIHDRSASGATFFIEPEEVLEMNNELRSLSIDEKEEIERILKELSGRVGAMGDELLLDVELLQELDCLYARAEYAYKTHSVKPEMNDCGKIEILRGRHPLIDAKSVVPVSLSLGNDYRFLLISGPNTGGKTVTLKMVGLFCIMAACGFFVPAQQAKLAVFEEIYCDVGDAQSIEESLSTFSSHMKNIIGIVERANARSLVLIDELGGGTDPDEGQALAKAVVSHLLQSGATGVVTTHYTSLKEFAYETDGIENACMEFDSNTLQPLYVIKIGLPGSSNALAISRRLGLKQSVLDMAFAFLSDGAQAFEKILRGAEESRIAAENELRQTNLLKSEWQEKLSALKKEREQLEREKEKFFASAKAEARRIIHQRAADAEELLAEMEELFQKETLTQSDLIQARTLKNKLKNLAYDSEKESVETPSYQPVDAKRLKVGDKVFVKSVNDEGVVQSIRLQKNEAEVLCGNLKVRSKISDLSVLIAGAKTQTNAKQVPAWKKKAQAERVQVQKSLTPKPAPSLEIQLLGLTVQDAIVEVDAFLDAALLANLEEVRIVHGMGTGKLRAGIHEYLKTHKHVAEFRLGRYGEGDTGVTIVKLK